MCGRVRLSSDVSEIKLVFSIPPHRPTPNFPPSWNLAPTDSLPVVRYDAKAHERSLECGQHAGLATILIRLRPSRSARILIQRS
jgi:putative SOS response-associated peptidase YedK